MPHTIKCNLVVPIKMSFIGTPVRNTFQLREQKHEFIMIQDAYITHLMDHMHICVYVCHNLKSRQLLYGKFLYKIYEFLTQTIMMEISKVDDKKTL